MIILGYSTNCLLKLTNISDTLKIPGWLTSCASHMPKHAHPHISGYSSNVLIIETDKQCNSLNTK